MTSRPPTVTPTATPPERPIRVFVVDDQQMVRAGFRMLVESQPDMVVVGEAGDGGEALERLAVTAADVVLMDVRMPRLDGVEATRALLQRTADVDDAPRVIVLTTFDLDEYAFAALRAGASAFLLKDAAPPELLGSIRSVHAGDAVVAPSTTRRLLEHFVRSVPPADAPGSPSPSDVEPADADERLAALTDREREVLQLVAAGRSNTEIAADLVVAEATVKTHVSRLLAKTGSRDRVQLVVLAYDVGLTGR